MDVKLKVKLKILFAEVLVMRKLLFLIHYSNSGQLVWS